MAARRRGWVIAPPVALVVCGERAMGCRRRLIPFGD